MLERVLDKFLDGVSLSTLKNEILEIDSAFDEQNLGFTRFMKFLQSAPEIATLYQVKQIWHAKALETRDDHAEPSPYESKSEVTLAEPTIDLYKRFLRKSGWRSCESFFLWDALTKLGVRFPEGFTRSEEFEYLIEAFGHNRTRGELRAAMYILYKAGFVTQQQQEQNDEPILISNFPESEKVMSRNIDAVMLHRLVYVCKSNNISFIPELITPLLCNSYTTEQFRSLIENARSY